MIDEKIIIKKVNLPKLIVDCIEKLEYYDKLKDEDMYYEILELLETTAKSFILEKKLSIEEYTILLKKYGGEI